MNKILIYRHGSIGDTIVALPCFHKIRESYPNAHITLLTNRPTSIKEAPLETILGCGYFFDRVITYPAATRNIFVIISLLFKIRSLQISTIIDLTVSKSPFRVPRDKIFFKAAGIKNLIGFPVNKEDVYYSIDVDTGDLEWEAKRLAHRLKSLGAIDLVQDRYWDLKLSLTEIGLGQYILSKLPNNNPIISISIGTKVQANDWGFANWILLLERIRIMFPHWNLIIIGSMDEVEIANNCLRAWGGQGLNLCGEVTPRVSAFILKKSQFFIGHDSGPMHMAGCVGTPCVAIFSARNLPGLWYPRGDLNQVIYHKTDCAGCGLTVCVENNKKCILSISVEEVVNAVTRIVDDVK